MRLKKLRIKNYLKKQHIRLALLQNMEVIYDIKHSAQDSFYCRVSSILPLSPCNAPYFPQSQKNISLEFYYLHINKSDHPHTLYRNPSGNMWKYRINEAGEEPYLLTKLNAGEEFEKPLEAMMQKYGPDGGIEKFYNERVRQYKDDSRWTLLDEQTGKRKASLKEAETYIRYIIRNGKKINH